MKEENVTVPIVTVTSPAFLKYALVMIWSVLERGRPGRRYVFHIFHNALTAERQEWLRQQLACWENCTVEFMDLRTVNRFGLNRADWTGKIACFTMFSLDLLTQYDKVLVLDVDLVAMHDVSELYTIDLGDCWLAGVHDLDFAGQWARGNRDYRDYYSRQVVLPDPENYVQSGVLVLNLRVLRQQFRPGYFAELAAARKFRYDDQDIWNMCCAGHICWLDYCWNVIHDNNRFRLRYVIDFAPDKAAYIHSRENPYIIHYAGDQKPWNDADCDFGEAFWDVASRTPVFRDLSGGVEPVGKRRRPLHIVCYELRRWWEKLRKLWT